MFQGLGNRGQVPVPSPGIHPVCGLLFLRRPPAQRTQYPLIKEYTLNHNIKAIKGLYNLRYIHKLMGIGFSGCLSFLFLFLSCPCSWTDPRSQGVPCCSLLFCWLCCWGSQLMHSLLCPSETRRSAAARFAEHWWCCSSCTPSRWQLLRVKRNSLGI